MIPKIIHCVWLSGEEKSTLYKQCMESWRNIMPEYQIREWSLSDLSDEIKKKDFVRTACEAHKWAYATDFIRIWLLYNYGGIYLDMDVMVYRSFDPFLCHRVFSSVEYNPLAYWQSIRKKKEINGVAIEAAVIGAEPEHPWIKDVLQFYENKKFINNQRFCFEMIMPRIIKNISKEYGFREIPIYQVLKEDVHLYPPDVFSSCWDLSVTGLPNDNMRILRLGEDNQTRYAFHICAHSWYESLETKKLSWKVKKIILCLLGKKFIDKIKPKQQTF